MWNPRTCWIEKLLVIGVVVVAVGRIYAQGQNADRESRSSFGVTRNEAKVYVADAITGSSYSRGVGILGFQYTYTHNPRRRLDLLTDFEFQLGMLDRGPEISTIFGGQAAAGPRVKLWHFPVAAHALGGISALRITEVYAGGGFGSPTIYYLGGDPSFRTFLNTYRSGGRTTLNHLPGSSLVSPVVSFGLSAQVRQARISGDFMKINRDGTQLGFVRAGIGFRF